MTPTRSQSVWLLPAVASSRHIGRGQLSHTIAARFSPTKWTTVKACKSRAWWSIETLRFVHNSSVWWWQGQIPSRFESIQKVKVTFKLIMQGSASNRKLSQKHVSLIQWPDLKKKIVGSYSGRRSSLKKNRLRHFGAVGRRPLNLTLWNLIFWIFIFLKSQIQKKSNQTFSECRIRPRIGHSQGCGQRPFKVSDPTSDLTLWTLIFEFSFFWNSQTRKKSNQTFLTVSDPTSDLTLWQVWLETPQSVRPPCYYTYYPAAPQQKRLGFKVPKRLGFRIPKSCFFNNVFCIDLQNIKTEDNPSAKSLMNATAERSRSSQINSRIYHDS